MKTILILPSSKNNILDYIKHKFSFDKIILLDDKADEQTILNLINNFEEIYFVDFENIYRKILPNISFKKKCISIITCELAEFTNPKILQIYNYVIEFYDRMIFKKIITLSFELYNVLLNAGYNVDYFNPNITFTNQKKHIKKKKRIVGVICDDTNPNNNFYNVLTALTMVEVDKVKLICHMNATKEFVNRFNIPVEYCSNIDEIIENSSLNIYTNFTGNDYSLFKKSIDLNIPCIFGNMDSNLHKKIAKKYILDSDDDVYELSTKIKKILDEIS